MVDFLLLIENITDYSKKNIDQGNTPFEIYKLCNCIREAFCMSYSIRKQNNLYFYYEKERVSIKFTGDQLRYLGSDERSQALLLLKALNMNKSSSKTALKSWVKSTPGIFIRKFQNTPSFLNDLENITERKFVFIVDPNYFNNHKQLSEKQSFEHLKSISEYFYIIPTYPISENFIQQLKGLKNFQFIDLSQLKRLSDKILYINYQIDKFHGL